MSTKISARATIGFLPTWSVYEGTTIDDYTRALPQGVCAAARESGCNLLIECGISLPFLAPGARWSGKIAWTVPEEKYILAVSIVRPTGFSENGRSHNTQGELILCEKRDFHIRDAQLKDMVSNSSGSTR